MNTSMRNIVLWALIFVGLFMVFDSQQQTSSTAISYSDLLSRVDNGQISQVTIQGQELHALTNDGHTITRGGARIVYAKYRLGEEIAASDRHLFYTYNHYNDFQEYLNYYQGWGQIFGNVTAGGEIDEVAPGGPTPYVDVVLQDLY